MQAAAKGFGGTAPSCAQVRGRIAAGLKPNFTGWWAGVWPTPDEASERPFIDAAVGISHARWRNSCTVQDISCSAFLVQ